MKVNGKITSSFDGETWKYTATITAKDLEGESEALEIFEKMMEAAGQTVLAGEEIEG